MNTASSPTRRFAGRTALVLLGLLTALLTIEGAWRGAGWLWRARQDLQNRRAESREADCVILCVGESTTGIGGNTSYPRLLEHVLNREGSDRRFRVINRGFPGTKTLQIIERLPALLDRHRPDIVVSMMGINDYTEDFRDPPWPAARFWESTRVARLTRHITTSLRARADRDADPPTKPPDDPSEPPPGGPVLLPHVHPSAPGIRRIPTRNCEDAERAFRRHIEKYPNDVRGYRMLVDAYISHAKWDAGEALARKALDIFPEDTPFQVRLVTIFDRQGRVQEAESAFRRAVAWSPEESERHARLVRFVLFHKTMWSKGQRSPLENVHLPPLNASRRGELVWAYWADAKLADEERETRRRLALSPGDARVWKVLGRILLRRQKPAEALTAHLHAHRLAPHNEIHCLDVARALRALGRLPEADDYLRKARALGERYVNPMTRRNYARLREIVRRHGARLVCAQYPMRDVKVLKKMLGAPSDVVFVDNDAPFREALRRVPYEHLFMDAFAGDFGHCTPEGNRLLAENIAKAIVGEIFGKDVDRDGTVAAGRKA